jgi:hypothetical protein
MALRGSCLCGGIGYEVQRLASRIQHCACRTCRKAHAAAFNTAARVRREDFRWLQGEPLLRAFESSPGKLRHFCGQCGTQLIATRDDWDHVVLRVATLDDDPGQQPALQIWSSHEVPWLAHGPQLPHYPEWEPGSP